MSGLLFLLSGHTVPGDPVPVPDEPVPPHQPMPDPPPDEDPIKMSHR